MHRSRRHARTLLAALSVTLAACNAHVQLPEAPGRGDPFPQRMAAYQQLRPSMLTTTTQLTMTRYGMVTGSYTTLNQLILANGAAVYHPEDLLPLVDAQSATAVAARESADERGVSNILVGSMIGASLLGTGLTLASFSGSSDTGRINEGMFYAGLGLVTAATVLYFVNLFGPSRAAASDRVSAFAAYEPSLRARLGLCEAPNGVVVDCAAPQPPPQWPVAAPAPGAPQPPIGSALAPPAQGPVEIR